MVTTVANHRRSWSRPELPNSAKEFSRWAIAKIKSDPNMMGNTDRVINGVQGEYTVGALIQSIENLDDIGLHYLYLLLRAEKTIRKGWNGDPDGSLLEALSKVRGI